MKGCFTSLRGRPVVGVLRPVPRDHLVLAIVPFEGEGDFENVMARFQHAHDTLGLLPLLFNGRQWAHVQPLDQAGGEDKLILRRYR